MKRYFSLIIFILVTQFALANRVTVDANGRGDFVTMSDAILATATSDTIYVIAAQSSYGNLSLTEQRVIIGNGYFGQSLGYQQSATFGSVTITSGANGTILIGCQVQNVIISGTVGVQVLASKINGTITATGVDGAKIARCFLEGDTNLTDTGSGSQVVNNIFTLASAATALTTAGVVDLSYNTFFDGNISIGASTVFENNIINSTRVTQQDQIVTNGLQGNAVDVEANLGFSTAETADKFFVLQAGSPALTASLEGTESGAFGRLAASPDPVYQLAGTPTIPSVLEIVSSISSSNSSGLALDLVASSNSTLPIDRITVTIFDTENVQVDEQTFSPVVIDNFISESILINTSALALGQYTYVLKVETSGFVESIPISGSWINEQEIVSNANIQALEYFFETEPGRGSGTQASVSPSPVIIESPSLATSTLSEGFQNIYVRGQDQNGLWGPYQTKTFYVSSAGSIDDFVEVEAIEYFVDSDPGFGLGTSLPISPSIDLVLSESLALSGLEPGFHTVYIRGKLTSGAWGPYDTKAIYVLSNAAVNDVVQIEALELFFNNDPGQGAGVPISISQGTEVAINEAVITSTLAPGFHTAYIRGKVLGGAWGPYTKKVVYVDENSQDATEVFAIEYFFDEDPGLGQATEFLPLTSGLELIEVINLSTSVLSPGIHTVSVRAQDTNGVWSHYLTQEIEVISGETVVSIGDGNWSDPSIWSTGTVPASIDSVVIGSIVSYDLPVDTVFSMLIDNDGVLNLNGNELRLSGHFQSRANATVVPSAGTLQLIGANQRFQQEGNLAHGNLLFSGNGLKTLELTNQDSLQVENSITVDPSAQLEISQSFPLVLQNTANFIGGDLSLSTSKWSLVLDGVSHLVRDGDFQDVSFLGENALILDGTSFNYEGELLSSGQGASIDLSSNTLNVGNSFQLLSGDQLLAESLGSLEATKGSMFSCADSIPNMTIDTNGEFFAFVGENVLGTAKILDVQSGVVQVQGRLALADGGSGISVALNGGLQVVAEELVFGESSFLTNDGSVSFSSGSTLRGAELTSQYTITSNGDLLVQESSISEIGSLSIVGGSFSLSNTIFSNGLGASYLSLFDGVNGDVYSGVQFDEGPTNNVIYQPTVAGVVTFDQYSGNLGGSDFSFVNQFGTIDWTNPLGTQGTIIIVAPNGGESYIVGETVSVTWNVADMPDEDILEVTFSSDGTSFETLVTGSVLELANSFDWTVPETTCTSCLIQIENITQGVSDQSDAPFSIQFPASGIPVALAAQNITSTSFDASWTPANVAVQYELDVSLVEDFSSFVLEAEVVTGTSVQVSDLLYSQDYFYRVRADDGTNVSDNSNIITLRTIRDAGTAADSVALRQIYNVLGGENWGVNWESDYLRDWAGVSLFAGTPRVQLINISGLGATGSMPATFSGLAADGGLALAESLDVSNNQITGLYDLSLSSLITVDVSSNRLEFDDIEAILSLGISNLTYANQASQQFSESIDEPIEVRRLSSTTLTASIAGSDVQYAWFRNGVAIASDERFTLSATTLTIDAIDFESMGGFSAIASSAVVPNLEIELEVQVINAVSDISFIVLDQNDENVTSEVSSYLLAATQDAGSFDTLEIAKDVASSFTFADVVLGDYLASIFPADQNTYIPTYFANAFQWEEAEVIAFRKDSTLTINLVGTPQSNEEGDGSLSGVIEEDLGEAPARLDARRRAARRKCGLRKRRTGGRTDQEDIYDLFAYGETNDEGEFEFGFLPEGRYRFFVEYPGIPLDEDAFVEFTVGEAGIGDTDFSLSAFVTEEGISVSIEKVLGVIFSYFKNLEIYPNPVSNHLNVQYRHLKAENVQAQLVDLSGVVHWQESIENGFDGQIKIDTRGFTEGIYLLRFFDKDLDQKTHILTYRIIVKD